METDEGQAPEETQYAVVFLPQRAWTMSGFVAFTTFMLSKHKITKQENQDEVRNFSTKRRH